MQQDGPSLSEWSLTKKLVLCFFFIFFVLYIFLNPNLVVPYSYYLHKFYIQSYVNLAAWLARDVLHVVRPTVLFYNGTTDTVFGYINLFFIAIVASVGAVIWVIIAKKTDYNKVYNLLLTFLRYYMMATWLAYGSLKIIQVQFPPISPLTLLKSYGSSTPGELAWAYMGYSAGYNFFIGLMEYAAGLLLFFRPTRTLGNVIGLVIITNVAAFDYTYGVNLKLLSTMLVLITLFLLSKDIKRLAGFFLLNKAVYPVGDDSFRFKKNWKNKLLTASGYLFMVYLIFFDIKGDIARSKPYSVSQRPPLYGIYIVTSFIRNNDTIQPLITDTNRWNKLIVSVPGDEASVMLMSGNFKEFKFRPNTITRKIEMWAKADTANKYTFTYNLIKDSVLLLQGQWQRKPLEIKLKEYDMRKFPLINSRFRWVIGHGQE